MSKFHPNWSIFHDFITILKRQLTPNHVIPAWFSDKSIEMNQQNQNRQKCFNWDEILTQIVKWPKERKKIIFIDITRYFGVILAIFRKLYMIFHDFRRFSTIFLSDPLRAAPREIVKNASIGLKFWENVENTYILKVAKC